MFPFLLLKMHLKTASGCQNSNKCLRMGYLLKIILFLSITSKIKILQLIFSSNQIFFCYNFKILSYIFYCFNSHSSLRSHSNKIFKGEKITSFIYFINNCSTFTCIKVDHVPTQPSATIETLRLTFLINLKIHEINLFKQDLISNKMTHFQFTHCCHSNKKKSFTNNE